MSLVNDMLRDLDRRKRLPGIGGSRLAYGSEHEQVTGNKNIIIAGIAMCILLLIAAGFYFTKLSVPATLPVNTSSSSVLPEVLVQENQASNEEAIQSEVNIASAPETLIARIAGERVRTNGFELRLEIVPETSFEVLSRTNNSLSILFSDVEQISNTITSLDYVTAELVDTGLMLKIMMNRDTDFVVYENRNDSAFAVVIEGFWKVIPAVTHNTIDSGSSNSGISASNSAAGNKDTGVLDSSRNSVANVLTEEPPVAPVRTQRVMSLEERDRTASQRALRQVQSGQMQLAFTSLSEFISENPEAHASRNTLITLLFAQQQYEQVQALVDEGLDLAPNLSSYKKIKARLQLMSGQHQEAIRLLESVPPLIAEDKEYFELLASLYQQTMQYSNAVATYQDLIRTDSNVGRWWIGMGISHESNGNFREAVSSFEVALQTPGLESSLRQYSQNRIRSLSN